MFTPIVTVTLNPAIDKIIKVKNFKTEQDSRENGISLSAGGKGVNVSRVLKNLNAKTIATGFLGGFLGLYIQKEFNKEEIKHDFLQISGQTRTNLTIIDSHQKITRVLERGPRISRRALIAFKKKFRSLLKSCRYVIFSGSIANGLPEAIYADLITIAKQKNIKTILDTSGKPLQPGLRARPWLVKPNREEAESVVGYKLNSSRRKKRAVKYFHKIGIETVIISFGAKGIVASDGKEILHADTPKLKCQNNVGCGDALVAGFVFAHQRGYGFKEAVRFSVCCAAANVRNLQPGSIEKGWVKKLTRRVLIKKIT